MILCGWLTKLSNRCCRRLRQICSHPSLITESSSAFITPEELEQNGDPEAAKELQRASELVGPDFVAKMQHRMKELAARRLQLEKESEDAVAEDEECPICFEQFENPVVTSCTHVFCATCIREVLATPRREDGEDGTRYKADERPCEPDKMHIVKLRSCISRPDLPERCL